MVCWNETASASAVPQVEPESATAKTFFPLTVPLTTGPGTMATVIALNANRTDKLSEFLLSGVASFVISGLVMLVIYYTYSRASVLARYLGAEGTRVALRARTRFGQLTAAGLTMTIFFYIAINLSMVMGLAPVVGIPLPLFSYGGSSMLTIMTCIGIILAVENDSKTGSRRFH